MGKDKDPYTCPVTKGAHAYDKPGYMSSELTCTKCGHTEKKDVYRKYWNGTAPMVRHFRAGFWHIPILI